MIIYYIRHGDPIYNPDSLTPLGIRQAEAVGRRLALNGIDEIYSSPSIRAIQTATPLSEMLHKPIINLDWCNESLVWNEFTVTNKEGKTDWMFRDPRIIEKFNERSIIELGDHWYKDPFFDKKVGEGVVRVNSELDRFLINFGYYHDRENKIYRTDNPSNKRIAIFAHEDFGKIFFSSILDIPYPMFSIRFNISHSGVSVINFSVSNISVIVPELLQHSNDSHLYKEGLPTKYNNGISI